MVGRINGIMVDVTPAAPAEEQPAIGLIGMGEMGRMYATHLSRAGWQKCASRSISLLSCPMLKHLPSNRVESMFAIGRKGTRH